MNTQVTMIIPTHNRHKYITRILDYYQDVEFIILVADSSKVRYNNSLSNNVKYYYFPNISIVEKLYEITKIIETKYVLLCADDDFWVKESINKCIDFLEQNETYTSVQGKYIDFMCKEKPTFIPSYLHAKSIEDEEIHKRLNSCMDNYMPLFYAMHRSKTLKRVFHDNYATDLDHAILNEMSVSLYCLTYGKYKNLELLTYVRDDESLPTPVKRDNLKDISEKEEFEIEYNQFISNISTLIEEEKPSLNGKKIITDAISFYTSKMEMNTPNNVKMKDFIKRYFFFLIPLVRSLKRKNHIKKVFEKTKDIQGYPHSDKDAKNVWVKISGIIKKHHIKV